MTILILISTCVFSGVPGWQRLSLPLCLSTMAWSSSSSWPTSAWQPSWTLEFTPEVGRTVHIKLGFCDRAVIVFVSLCHAVRFLEAHFQPFVSYKWEWPQSTVISLSSIRSFSKNKKSLSRSDIIWQSTLIGCLDSNLSSKLREDAMHTNIPSIPSHVGSAASPLVSFSFSAASSPI